jgi:hypothetical protein
LDDQRRNVVSQVVKRLVFALGIAAFSAELFAASGAIIVSAPPFNFIAAKVRVHAASDLVQIPGHVNVTGEQVMATWREQGDAGTVGFWRLFSTNGRPVSDPVSVGRTESDLAVAASGDHFLLTWSVDRGGVDEVVGLRVGFDGKPLDGESFLIASGGRTPTVASDGLDFMVAWSEKSMYRDGLRDVRAAIVTHAGLPSPNHELLSAGDPAETPVVIWSGVDYVVAWQLTYELFDEINARRVDGAGIVKGRISPLMTFRKYGHKLRSCAAGNGELLVGAIRLDGSLAFRNDSWMSERVVGPYVIFDGMTFIASSYRFASIADRKIVGIGTMTAGSAEDQTDNRVFLAFTTAGRRRGVRPGE